MQDNNGREAYRMLLEDHLNAILDDMENVPRNDLIDRIILKTNFAGYGAIYCDACEHIRLDSQIHEVAGDYICQSCYESMADAYDEDYPYGGRGR